MKIYFIIHQKSQRLINVVTLHKGDTVFATETVLRSGERTKFSDSEECIITSPVRISHGTPYKSYQFNCEPKTPSYRESTKIYVKLEVGGSATVKYVTTTDDKKDTTTYSRTASAETLGFEEPKNPSWSPLIHSVPGSGVPRAAPDANENSVPGSEVPRAAPDANENNASEGPAKKKARKGVKNVSE